MWLKYYNITWLENVTWQETVIWLENVKEERRKSIRMALQDLDNHS